MTQFLTISLWVIYVVPNANRPIQLFCHFPGGPVVKIWPSNAGGAAKIPHASGPKNQNINRGSIVTN